VLSLIISGLVGRLTGYHEERRLYFVLCDGCSIVGFKDEASMHQSSPEVSFDCTFSAVTINQQSTTQFELIGGKTRWVFL